MLARQVLFAGLAGASLFAPFARCDEFDFFENEVRPVLAQHCYKCHGAKQQKGGIRLDGPKHLENAGDGSGPLVVPGDLEQSRLIQAVLYTDEPKMPPAGKLPDHAIDALKQWVKKGAPWPAEKARGRTSADHWAFRPVRAPSVPTVHASDWPVTEIDRFILARLEARKLSPSPTADRRTLIRRITFDLTGLPPTEHEVEAFERDQAPGAYAILVDRLLASKQFGERWARHWLDVARYADSKGPSANAEIAYPSAYSFRDWAVRAFNVDLPYDQFLVKQIAADHQARVQNHPDLAALGFLTLGRKFEGSEPDIIDDRLDVIFRGAQGLSIGCARCHDHKYDPISIRDYYALYGVFAGAKEKDEVIVTGPEQRLKALAYAAELRARSRDYERFLEAERKRVFGDHRRKAEQYLMAAQLGGGEPRADATGKRPDGLHQAIVNLYKTLLERTRTGHHRVMSPWQAFAALKPDEFASKAKPLAAGFAANDDEEKPLNPMVAQLFSGKPPADLAEVARRFGKLFATTARKWEKLIAEADRADRERPTELDNEAEDEIRQLICGPGAPLDDRAAGDIKDLLDSERRAKHDELQKAVQNWTNDPSAPPMARVLDDPDQPAPARVFRRGKPEEPGEEVPRRFLPLLGGSDANPFVDGSGRYELARAIARKDNPLTARVWVNRVWGHLLGRGLVATPSDFGTRSSAPSHPELLDWLADSLVADGWSTKRLIRKIVLSRTYQQASTDRPEPRASDPANELLWRMNRKRLELEPLRDAMLAASGLLDLTAGGRPVDIGDEPNCRRRTLYLAVKRESLPSFFRAFDFANPDLHVPARHETTVPQQALFLLNGPFVAEQARALARRAEQGLPTDDETWVRQAYRAALGRDPSTEDRNQAVAFLAAASTLEAIGPGPTAAWRYGIGDWDEAGKSLVSFTPLTHFENEQWQAGSEFPDPVHGYLALRAEGGHPGSHRQQAAVRRWVAPSDGMLAIEGLARHQLPAEASDSKADGIRCLIVSARNGILFEAGVRDREVRTAVAQAGVTKGEFIDFITDPQAGDAFDSFGWKVTLSLVPAGRPREESCFDSAADFRGPDPTSPPLSPREKLAQVLLLCNEFTFVD